MNGKNGEFDLIQEGAEWLRGYFGEPPPVGVVLGSGLGGLVEAMEGCSLVPYANVSHWIPPSVSGHNGQLVVGEMDRVRCVMLSGRAHLYEGFTPAEVVRHVRTLRLWGVRVLVLTCAAGGIFRGTQSGDLMVITDHINLTGVNPLVGRHDPRLSVRRFPDQGSGYAWDATMTAVLNHAFSVTGIQRREGTYVGVLGPTYETPAEVDMLDAMGGNAVGMSMVHENVGFRAMLDQQGKHGVVCGVAMLANPAAGRGGAEVLEHADITAACQVAGGKLTRVLHMAIPLMPERVI